MTATVPSLASTWPAAPAVLQPFRDMHGFGGGMAGVLYWGSALLGVLFALALLFLIVAVAWRLLRRGDRDAGTSGRPTAESPVEILERRYARGELDREDFLQKRDDLRKS